MTADEQAYFIRASAEAPVQGPFALSRIKAYVASGRVNAKMEFSKDGEDWWPGATWQAVFPEAQSTRPPPPPPPQPPPAPAPRRRQAAVPARSKSARSPRSASDADGQREAPGRRTRKPRPSPAILWGGALLVVGGIVAMIYFALAPSQAEQDREKVIALMEETCEIMEAMEHGEVDLAKAVRLIEIRSEVLALNQNLRGTPVSAASGRKFERRVLELAERIRRASARLEDPDDPAPPVR